MYSKISILNSEAIDIHLSNVDDNDKQIQFQCLSFFSVNNDLIDQRLSLIEHLYFKHVVSWILLILNRFEMYIKKQPFSVSVLSKV